MVTINNYNNSIHGSLIVTFSTVVVVVVDE